MRSCYLFASILMAASSLSFAVPMICTPVVVQPLTFNAYKPNGYQHNNSIAIIKVTCNQPGPVTYTLCLGADQVSSGAAEQMHNDKQNGVLQYHLYADVNHIQLIHNGTNLCLPTVSANNCSKASNCQHVFYGVIDPQQKAVVGTYRDNLVITLDLANNNLPAISSASNLFARPH